MLYYNQKNKRRSQILRKNLTDAEALLWYRLRRKQLCGVQFYRQRPILNYIVDFYAPIAKLVIEVDGGQHFEPKGMNQDRLRDESLKQLGLKVLRFNNLEVLQSLDDVVSHIFNQIIYTNPP